tara:strand:- start:339 stop:1175 length:837 start_codon:yes stop_codon:yes gene_type:complete
MPRIRTIKPDFWTSEQIVECSTNARLLFVGMWNFCDDGGVHPASVLRLKMEVYPGDDFTTDQMTGWIDELQAAGLLVEFEAQGKSWWVVTGWKHQKIDRPSLRFPQPEFDDHSTNDRRTIVDGHPPEKEKEKEKEKDVKERRGIAPQIPGGDISHENKPPDGPKPKRGRRPAVSVDDVTLPDGMDTPGVRSALDDWLGHRRTIRKGYRSAESVVELMAKWQPRGPTEFVSAVSHSIANEYQGLFSETNGTKRPGNNRFGPGEIFTPGAGNNDPGFGKM